MANNFGGQEAKGKLLANEETMAEVRIAIRELPVRTRPIPLAELTDVFGGCDPTYCTVGGKAGDNQCCSGKCGDEPAFPGYSWYCVN